MHVIMNELRLNIDSVLLTSILLLKAQSGSLGHCPSRPCRRWGKIISHHSSLYWGWADHGLWSWFLCSFPVNGERQQAVMALQPAPAADTQITEVIIYNQRAQKIYWHLSALYSGRFHFLSVSFCDWACSPWLWPNNWWHLQ